MDQKVELPENPVILFDGVCNLCIRSVQFIIRRDKQKIFCFASLQSNFGKQIMTGSLKTKLAPDSIVLHADGKIFVRSQAIIRIAKLLGGFFKLAVLLQIIPVFILDALYDFLAKHRHQWFGKRKTCMAPDTRIAERFLN
jgi:predicted DCC family thiol-disulfide oxidoreductase YuxK